MDVNAVFKPSVAVMNASAVGLEAPPLEIIAFNVVSATTAAINVSISLSSPT
jgi:hypothetical protein